MTVIVRSPISRFFDSVTSEPSLTKALCRAKQLHKSFELVRIQCYLCGDLKFTGRGSDGHTG